MNSNGVTRVTESLREHAGNSADPRPCTSGTPVSLVQDEDFNAAQVEGRAVVEMVDEPARRGDEDVGCCPESGFLRLQIQATCGADPMDSLLSHSSVVPATCLGLRSIAEHTEEPESPRPGQYDFSVSTDGEPHPHP